LDALYIVRWGAEGSERNTDLEDAVREKCKAFETRYDEEIKKIGKIYYPPFIDRQGLQTWKSDMVMLWRE
jgi:hypothetical protein